MKKIVLKIKGMHCSSCALNIDGELEDTDGIHESNTSYAKQITTVTFNSNLIDEPKIVEVIKRVGYQAQIL